MYVGNFGNCKETWLSSGKLHREEKSAPIMEFVTRRKQLACPVRAEVDQYVEMQLKSSTGELNIPKAVIRASSRKSKVEDCLK
jgi:hypothetical protein